MIMGVVTMIMLAASGYLFWRYVWFFRNPKRCAPHQEGILSPADGRVVYVKEVEPGERVISIKKGVMASVNDIVREEMDERKVLIGIFMSPFNVHYNRSPLSGTVGFLRHYPGRGPNLHMGAMHLRTLLGREPYSKRSMHIIQNERTVTKIRSDYRGEPLSCYIVQIAARSVHGIESYVEPGGTVERGEIFGMIRIGSQVDLVVPWKKGMQIRVYPGKRVFAGETIVIA